MCMLLEAGKRSDSTVCVEFMLEVIRDALVDVKAQQSAQDAARGEFATTDGNR